MTGIRPAELDDRLSAGAALFVLDARPEADHQADAIEDSHNVRTVVVVCKLGIVAKRATRVRNDEEIRCEHAGRWDARQERVPGRYARIHASLVGLAAGLIRSVG